MVKIRKDGKIRRSESDKKMTPLMKVIMRIKRKERNQKRKVKTRIHNFITS
jgi:hypothetical protein